MVIGSQIGWEWLGIAWIALGLAAVFVLELAARSSSVDGPLSQESLPSSIAYSAALIVGAPLLLLYSFGVCLVMLWQGRVPMTNRFWWHARAAKFDRTVARPRRETILVEMIEVRRRRDSRLRGAKPADNWPMFQLWKTPEATILNAIEDFCWLKDDGLTDQAALQRLQDFPRGNGTPSFGADFTLRGLIALRLNKMDPSYSALVDKILSQQIEIARKWAKNEIQWTKSEPAFPPIEWLQRRISVEEIDPGKTSSGPGIWNHKDWHRIKARISEYDELWEFSSPRESWKKLAGRGGIALIRDGRSIAYIITVIN